MPYMEDRWKKYRIAESLMRDLRDDPKRRKDEEDADFWRNLGSAAPGLGTGIGGLIGGIAGTALGGPAGGTLGATLGSGIGGGIGMLGQTGANAYADEKTRGYMDQDARRAERLRRASALLGGF